MEFEDMSASQLLAAAERPQASFVPSATIVMAGRQLAPQDVKPQPEPQPQPQPEPQPVASGVPEYTPRKARGASATTGRRGPPKKDNLSNPEHLWAISGKKGTNGKGTMIWLHCQGVEIPVPRTACKGRFDKMQAPCQVELIIETEGAAVGQRHLIIGRPAK